MVIMICAVVLLAKWKHYQIKPVFRSWSVYPILLMQIILVVFQFSVFFDTYYFVRFAPILDPGIIASFVFSIFVYKLYKPAVIGSSSVVLGTLLNNFVMAQNGGKMPVFPTLSYFTGYVTPDVFASVEGRHILGSEATRFAFLSDYIDVGYSILSIGDVLIHLFSFILLYATIKAANQRYAAANERQSIKM